MGYSQEALNPKDFWNNTPILSDPEFTYHLPILCLHTVTSSIHSSRERPGARFLLIMKPPNVVISISYQAECSKNLFTIIMSLKT